MVPEIKKNVYYPPGGILLWIIISLELLTFGAALVIMMVYRNEDPALFHQSRLQLSRVMGTINTVFLLTSGYCMAESARKLKLQEFKSARFFLRLTILFGLFFVVLKLFEYSQKLEAGLGFSANMFFSFYWSLTIFHLAHVLTGLVILLFFFIRFRKSTGPAIAEYESATVFWHLCDMIWLLIFPALYLLF